MLTLCAQKQEAVADTLKEKFGRASEHLRCGLPRDRRCMEINKPPQRISTPKGEGELRVPDRNQELGAPKRATEGTAAAEAAGKEHFVGAHRHRDLVRRSGRRWRSCSSTTQKDHEVFELKGGFLDGNADRHRVRSRRSPPCPSLDAAAREARGPAAGAGPRSSSAAAARAPASQLARLTEARRGALLEESGGS